MVTTKSKLHKEMSNYQPILRDKSSINHHKAIMGSKYDNLPSIKSPSSFRTFDVIATSNLKKSVGKPRKAQMLNTHSEKNSLEVDMNFPSKMQSPQRLNELD